MGRQLISTHMQQCCAGIPAEKGHPMGKELAVRSVGTRMERGGKERVS